jgi:hypothetical protein
VLAIANDGDIIDATGISGSITLTSGELLVDKSVTINGAGADVLAVDGNASSRIFHIDSGETTTISGLTIRNGHDDTIGGAIENEAGGTLTITDSNLTGNTAGTVGNPAVAGGGIYNLGSLTIVNSTVSANTASTGGRVQNAAPATTVTITNSTFSGNSVSAYGGACVNDGTMQITNSTFSGNSASIAGGILVLGPLQIGHTILDRNDSGANIDSFGEVMVVSLGYNLSSDDGSGHLTAPGDQINTDPVLGPLQDNGGSTFTHALLSGSPAIDTGDPNFTPPPFFDQRGSGFDRVVNGRIDKGSFEMQEPAATPTPTRLYLRRQPLRPQLLRRRGRRPRRVLNRPPELAPHRCPGRCKILFAESPPTSVFDAIPFEQRITHPGSHGFPDATFDYLFGKNVKFGKPIITQSNVSDHLPVTCDVTIQ